MRIENSWHIEAESGPQGLYLRCTLCGESCWIPDAGSEPQRVADFAVNHDHQRSALQG